jgi:endonuclease I
MKKNFTLLAFLFCSVIGLAQIPAGYYSTAIGSGYTLKTQLKNIIDNNTNSTGTASYSDMWTLFTTSAFRDNYYENDGSLLDIYSEVPNISGNTTFNDSYSFTSSSQQCGSSTPSAEGVCYNREHTIPQSVFSSAYPFYSDAHFVLPTDNRVNGWRDNYPFGKVVTTSAVAATNTTVSNADNIPVYMTNQSRLGQNTNTGYTTGYSGVVYEPLDEFKGDIARAMLYFATRYEDQIPSWSYVMFNGTSNQVFTNTFLNIMLTWHNIDPVSSYEIAKNNAVYLFQGNRNPFIDNPAYVCQIYTAQCTALSSDSFAFESGISIYPNPAINNEITISSETELKSIVLYNINGQIIQEIKNPTRVDNSYKLNNLSNGFYLVQLASENAVATKKVIIN